MHALCSIPPGVAEARMRKRKTLSLRVSAEFKKKLVEEAKREKRSVTSYIEVMLGKLWDERAGQIKE
jgi:predicted HicB family RNase H-like nuclease